MIYKREGVETVGEVASRLKKIEMAGSMAMIAIEQEISITDQWEIQYARFVYYPSLSSTCPNLIPRGRFPKSRFKGSWISTSSSSSASLQLHTDRSSSDVLLAVHCRGRIQEEHYISKLNFTWPQVSCVSGFPTRGTRAVFASYKDGVGKIQKFALRFSKICETEAFINALKDITKDTRDVALPSYGVGSETCQSEFVHSQNSPYRPTEEFNSTSPVENSTTGMPPSSSYEVEQLSNSQETVPSHNNEGRFLHSQDAVSPNFEGVVAALPPSFTSLLTNCCAEVNNSQPTLSKEVDLKSQIAKYMEDSSFLDMLVKVEKVVNEL